MADKCDPIRSKLHDLKKQLEKIREWVSPEPGERHPRKPYRDPDWVRINGEIRRTSLDLKACEDSLSD